MRMNEQGYVERIKTNYIDPTVLRPINTGANAAVIFVNGIRVPKGFAGRKCRLKVEWVDEVDKNEG